MRGAGIPGAVTLPECGWRNCVSIAFRIPRGCGGASVARAAHFAAAVLATRKPSPALAVTSWPAMRAGRPRTLPRRRRRRRRRAAASARDDHTPLHAPASVRVALRRCGWNEPEVAIEHGQGQPARALVLRQHGQIIRCCRRSRPMLPDGSDRRLIGLSVRCHRFTAGRTNRAVQSRAESPVSRWRQEPKRRTHSRIRVEHFRQRCRRACSRRERVADVRTRLTLNVAIDGEVHSFDFDEFAPARVRASVERAASGGQACRTTADCSGTLICYDGVCRR